MKPEETVDYHIRAAWYGFFRMYNQEAVKHGFTTSIGFVLLNLHFEIGTPATKIAPLMGMESRSLSRMLKSMEVQGLIRKQQDKKDKRSVLIFLTEKGREKRKLSGLTVKGFNEKLNTKISTKDFSTFIKVMNIINNQIESHTELKG